MKWVLTVLTSTLILAAAVVMCTTIVVRQQGRVASCHELAVKIENYETRPHQSRGGVPTTDQMAYNAQCGNA